MVGKRRFMVWQNETQCQQLLLSLLEPWHGLWIYRCRTREVLYELFPASRVLVIFARDRTTLASLCAQISRQIKRKDILFV